MRTTVRQGGEKKKKDQPAKIQVDGIVRIATNLCFLCEFAYLFCSFLRHTHRISSCRVDPRHTHTSIHSSVAGPFIIISFFFAFSDFRSTKAFSPAVGGSPNPKGNKVFQMRTKLFSQNQSAISDQCAGMCVCVGEESVAKLDRQFKLISRTANHTHTCVLC